MELAGWTNDRLVEERLHRLPRSEWVYGRANSSIVMASFMHVAPGGMRFNGPELGAWYAAASLTTSVVEVAHHMRREAHATGMKEIERDFRVYTARLAGKFVDICGKAAAMPDIYDSSDHSAAQQFGEAMRAAGETGILYDSLRHKGGINVVSYRPSQILDVVQTDHYRISVSADHKQIRAAKLNN